MAIVFLQQKKSQRNLFLIFLGIISIAAFVVWQGFFKKETETPLKEISVLPKEEIIIDFEVLKNPLLKTLQPFPEILPFQPSTSTPAVGRENPFLPY